MKRILCLFLTVVMLAAYFPQRTAVADENPFASHDLFRKKYIESSSAEFSSAKYAPNYAPELGDKYIVTFKEEASLDSIFECVSNYSYRLLADSSERVFSLCLASLSDFRDKYSSIVSDIAEDTKLSLSAIANDPLSSSQWELDFLDLYQAWDIEKNDRSITVAVLDSGIFREHEDFEAVNILSGYDAVSHSVGIDFDATGHGTQVCSIIAAKRDNSAGICGVTDNVSILPIRVSDETGYVHSSDFIEAVYYAADAGANVINMSFGGYIYSAQEEAAMRYAAEKGCISVSAAGNEATSPDYAGMKSYPASYADVISVGACDVDGSACSFSQHNDSVDMLAPGYMVTVANTNGEYETASGTSYSAAYVSGIIAMALCSIDAGYSFSADQFTAYIAYLRNTIRDDRNGYGAINALSVLESVNIPMVSGVMNGGVYLGNIKVEFNRGTATLDGKPFLSGESVIVSGIHHLELTEDEEAFIFEFITDNIPLQYDYKQNSNNAVFTFKRGTATVDGLPYISGTAITSEGRHLFEITGPYGNSESFEFVCEFEAPGIFGVEDGKRYDTAVSITVPKGGIVTLDGKTVANSIVVSENGKHTVVSQTADGKKTKKATFHINIQESTVYTATIANARIAADEKHGFLLMYNDFLSGTRVFTTADPGTTRNFIRTEHGIIDHSMTASSIVLLHKEGVSVLNRKAVGEGIDAKATYIPFVDSSVCAFVHGEKAYYLVKKSMGLELRCLNTTTSGDTLIATLDGKIQFLSGDGTYIVAATERELFVYDTAGKLLNKEESPHKITALVCGNGYICTNSLVFNANGIKKQFSLFADESPIAVNSGLLITNKSVYSIDGGVRIARFSTSLHDIAITESGNVYKSLAGMEFELIRGEGELNENNCSVRFNAYKDNNILFTEPRYSSIYVSHADLLISSNISDMGIDADSSVIHAVCGDEHMFYLIDGSTATIKIAERLRFAPKAVCFDGNNYYVSFSDNKCIYVYSAKSGTGTYYSVSHSYNKLLASDGKLYGLTDDGSLYVHDSEKPESTAKVVIVSQNIVSFDVENGYVYAYLKPASVSMVYKINASSGFAEAYVNVRSENGRIFVDDGKVFVGKAVLDTANLATIYRLTEDIEFADGNYILTSGGLYHTADGALITKCTIPTESPVFDKNYNYYNISDIMFTKIDNVRSDLHSAPSIIGVTDGGMYEEKVTVKYSYGNAYINGKLIPSGSTISDGGRHTLVLALPFGVNKTVSFTINANISGIDIYAESNTIRVNQTTSLRVYPVPSSYGAVDVIYSTDNTNVIVAEDGTVLGASEGDCTITATTLDGKHSDSVKIKVVKTVIDLSSSYFDMLKDGLTIRVSAGTAVNMLYEAIKETPGNSFVLSADGVRVDGGILTTGMLVRLYDRRENIIDERVLSVLGDVDCDGYITANDYFVLQQLTATHEEISHAVFVSADTDGNGTINAFDLLNVKEHLLNVNIIDIESPSPERQAKAALTVTTPPSVNPGSRFTVGLLLNEAANVSAFNGKLKFNTSQLIFENAEIAGDGWSGEYGLENGELSFFTYGRATGSAKVLLLVSFTVMPVISMGNGVLISVEDILVYDGSAAVMDNLFSTVATTEQPAPYITLHNNTAFAFDPEQTEYNVHFPAETDRIYISVSPYDTGEVVGITSFGNGLEVDFSVVIHNGDNMKQYEFHCTKDEGSSLEKPPVAADKDNDCSLSDIVIENGYLAPAFSASVYEYYCITDGEPKVSPIPSSKNATVSVSELDTNSSRITVTCTAEDGSAAIYILNIRRGNPAGSDFIPEQKVDFTPYIIIFTFAVLLVAAGIISRSIMRKRKNKE